MPEITPEALNRAISEVANGLGIDDLMARFGEEASRRTLQRRLDEMVRAGQLERVGKARATKYRVAQPPTQPAPAPLSIPLSARRGREANWSTHCWWAIATMA